MAKRSVLVRGRSQRVADSGWLKHLVSVRPNWFGVALAALAVQAGAACQNRDPRSVGVAAETQASGLATIPTASASQILAAIQAQPGSPVQPAVAQGFASAAGGLRPQFSAAATATEPKPASVVLPQLCTAALHLADVASGAAVDISLNGALAVAAQTVGGYVVYPSALGVGATVLHRALPGGSEDFISLPTRPATAEVDYSVALGSGYRRAPARRGDARDAGRRWGAPAARVAAVHRGG